MALTLRLDEKESDKLDRIMGRLEVGTASGAIKKMIMTFEEMMVAIEGTRYKLANLEKDKEIIIGLIEDQREAKKRVNALQSKISYWASK